MNYKVSIILSWILLSSCNPSPDNEFSEVKGIIFKLTEKDSIVQRSAIGQRDIEVLDRYASKYAISGLSKSCQVRAIYGCNSCCSDDIEGNRVVTDCGEECWVCGQLPCDPNEK